MKWGENITSSWYIDGAHDVVYEEDENETSANLTTADSTSVITTIISSAQTKDLCNSSL